MAVSPTTCIRALWRLPYYPVAAPILKRHFARGAIRFADTSTAPRVTSLSFWQSLIPKPFRRPDDPVSVAERQRLKSAKSKEWNPATFFIAIAVLIGSNAIQMIALRNERLRFTRKTEAKLALLRETIERVRKGENVDVERILGAGDAAKEHEWEQVMKELESDDALWQTNQKKRELRAQEQDAQKGPSSTLTTIPPLHTSTSPQSTTSSPPLVDPTPRRPGFY